jgi:lipoprotein-anchoring transpeptidase ErfK/SrfK
LKIKTFVIPLLALGLIYGIVVARTSNQPQKTSLSQVKATHVVATKSTVAATNYCEGYGEKTIVVSITEKHLWACQDDESTYDSPVVTGDMNNAANLTPAGMYSIYSKQTDRYLSGSDTKGKWYVHVNYWMPFLHNQYGSYGFHDATWRDNSEFGNVDPYSDAASHGCVELPLTASKWLYDWSVVGTKVVVRD